MLQWVNALTFHICRPEVKPWFCWSSWQTLTDVSRVRNWWGWGWALLQPQGKPFCSTVIPHWVSTHFVLSYQMVCDTVKARHCDTAWQNLPMSWKSRELACETPGTAKALGETACWLLPIFSGFKFFPLHNHHSIPHPTHPNVWWMSELVNIFTREQRNIFSTFITMEVFDQGL